LGFKKNNKEIIMSDNVYIIGVGMIKFGKYLEKSVKMLTGEALELVLKDCHLSHNDIEAAWFSNSGWGLQEYQHSIRGQVALSANGLDKITIVNVENACASGSTALFSANMAIKAGYDCVLAIGAEKGYNKDRETMMRGFVAGADVEEMRQQEAAEKKRLAEEAATKGEKAGEKSTDHSVFMDFYGAGARWHMKQYGTTRRQLAVIAAKNHNNSTLNPLAQYTFPQTIEQVLEDRIVSYPLTRAMCAPIGDGSAAAIVCSERFLKAHPTSRAVLIRASILKSGTRDVVSDIAKRASTAAYEKAGVGPEDINVMEMHDASAFGELLQTENMGLCKPGEGGPFAESGTTQIGGKIPVNTSGGLISRGHPIGASGLAMAHELVTQLRGEAGKRQVANARLAMSENGGGALGNGDAAMAIHIFEKIS